MLNKIVKRISLLFRKNKGIAETNIARQNILNIENKIKELPGAMLGDCFPLKHTFVDGAYVREISMPKGALLTSKIHKITHPYFVLKGDVSVLTKKGVQRIKAPYSGVTLAGTKRVLYCHEDTTWITVHVTKNTDLKKIEKEIIAESFDDVEDDKMIDIEKTIKQLQEV